MGTLMKKPFSAWAIWLTPVLRSTLSPRLLLALLFLSTINSRLSTIRAQGTLTPPGAPAPAMKTLTQIEPRTPISSLPYTVTNGGSYYLTANLTGVALQSGITIQADDVTLDLNGFTLIGVPTSSSGIDASCCAQ